MGCLRILRDADLGDLAEAELVYVRSLSEAYPERVERENRREASRVGDGTEPPRESVRQSRGAAFGTTVDFEAASRIAD